MGNIREGRQIDARRRRTTANGDERRFMTDEKMGLAGFSVASADLASFSFLLHLLLLLFWSESGYV